MIDLSAPAATLKALGSWVETVVLWRAERAREPERA